MCFFLTFRIKDDNQMFCHKKDPTFLAQRIFCQKICLFFLSFRQVMIIFRRWITATNQIFYFLLLDAMIPRYDIPCDSKLSPQKDRINTRRKANTLYLIWLVFPPNYNLNCCLVGWNLNHQDFDLFISFSCYKASNGDIMW